MNQNQVKVYIKTLIEDKEFFGYIYLNDGQRVQDLVNDDRSFVPVNRQMRERSSKEDVYKMVMLNKSIIGYIEEV